jgi:hypothetical protein
LSTPSVPPSKGALFNRLGGEFVGFGFVPVRPCALPHLAGRLSRGNHFPGGSLPAGPKSFPKISPVEGLGLSTPSVPPSKGALFTQLGAQITSPAGLFRRGPHHFPAGLLPAAPKSLPSRLWRNTVAQPCGATLRRNPAAQPCGATLWRNLEIFGFGFVPVRPCALALALGSSPGLWVRLCPSLCLTAPDGSPVAWRGSARGGEWPPSLGSVIVLWIRLMFFLCQFLV